MAVGEEECIAAEEVGGVDSEGDGRLMACKSISRGEEEGAGAGPDCVSLYFVMRSLCFSQHG